ncbi:hypothetical protein SODALDRAFT_279814 [Sodiomyces alkalinus F11]|uniref:Chromatin remodeling factor mit1 n=1 Tax=Sodiomyces alkalinus (strain CBS 110278 / VKM F-3762 / F11) TaxID=1314773 RepID=A0A3N2PT44_SODAK|nr:hypothetical protein SODALDRAFT_279814 [Sodiomyces alkalinus F11]ROT37695.1 hypothetical protein SODALDRAFT_279814 [Sodiomyces alkalinus F11]
MRPTTFEIVFPRLSDEARNQYVHVQSDVVDFLIEEITNDPRSENAESLFKLEYTDGRQDYVPLAKLLDYPGGRRALQQFEMNHSPGSQFSHPRRGKRGTQCWDDFEDDSGSNSISSDDLTTHDDNADDLPARPAKRLRLSRSRNTRQAGHSQVGEDEEEEEPKSAQNQPQARQLRERRPKQLTLTSMGLMNGLDSAFGEDELAQDSFFASNKASDNDDFTLVTSDINPTRGRPRKNMRPKSTRLGKSSDPKSRGSSIEFEDRRRSGRATRNLNSMRDTTALDDDDEEFYIVDTREPTVPRAISAKEVFQPLPPDSDFPLFHTPVCETCGQGPVSSKGQLIGCQGCCLTFHKVCLGYRAQRDHLATKIGNDSFVLQCKWCIGMHLKKDKNAPRYSACQSCKENSPSCAPFSQKKTATQEEKLRAENDGVDPITPVDTTLVNNPQHVLFRCTKCKRGWHFEHLPAPSGQQSTPNSNASPSSVREQRRAEYSGDWSCRDCATTNDKVQTLVAWRPVSKDVEPGRSCEEFREDDKEYLVKWQDRSYSHCSWMPGAWIFGTVTAASRLTFAKKDAAESLLKRDEKDAIPEEYLLIDVVLLAKMDKSSSSSRKERSKEADLARISHVKQIYVKFQGLSYHEAVWDSPPSPDSGRIYDSFKAAYEEYLSGKHFPNDSCEKMRDRVRAYKDSPFEDLKVQPPGIKRGKLMEYQMEGVSWILYNYHQNRNVILADEMGLGKTVQVVTLITTLVQDKPRCWPFMVVVPNSTCANWRREIKYWAPDLRVVTYHGGRRPQELAYKYELFPDGSSHVKAHVVVMSYDSAQDERTKSLFSSVHWAGLVVDEGQRLKNDRNLLYTALKSMRFPFRLLLTGTPLQNNKRELFNLLQFVDLKHNAAKLDEQYSELNATNLPELHEKIRPYFLRRTKAQVLKFLPPMAQIILPVSMTILQEKLCKSIMSKSPELIKAIFANKKIRSKERGSLNNILVQLRKCLCHPFLYSEAIEEKSADPETMHRNLISASAKLLLLEIMLPKLKERGHRVLIFSQFLGQLDIMEDFLNGMGFDHRRLDGSISSLEKQKRIDDFNAPDSPVFAFLLSTRAGGVGINLATADTVIILDPDFNPHQDIQALSRAHRIGQKKKVLCFQLMTKNSPEEKIMAIGRSKMALDHVLIESMDNEVEAGDDLEDILKFGASTLFSDEQDQKDIIRYDDANVDKLLDRSGMEQTKSDEGTAESQFSFARVWANEKGSFDEQLAEHKDPTLQPSIWERILAEREAEAQRIAEENAVTLGRGGRRRRAVNYSTTDAADNAEPSGSDVDPDFGTDSDQEEQDDEESTSEPEIPATVAVDKSKVKGRSRKSTC